MTKTRIYAILALGGLVALGASGQTVQSGDTSVYAPAGAGQNAAIAADQGAYRDGEGDEIPDAIAYPEAPSGVASADNEAIPDASVALIEPYDGYGELSLDELSAVLSMPAGPESWDLGEFARWQEPPAGDVYGEPVVIIDEGEAIMGLIDLPAEDEGQGELAAAQPQALPEEPATATVAPRPLVPNAPLTALAPASLYGTPGTVYATTAEYSCEPQMYAPVYYNYYYAYPYAGAYGPIVMPFRTNRLWPPLPLYCIYPRWQEDFFLHLPPDPIWISSTPYFGTYIGSPYGGYFGTYIGYPYASYYTYIGYPYLSYYSSYPHYRHFGSGSLLSFSFGSSSWSIYAQLGLSTHLNWRFRSGHDRDVFLRHSGSRITVRGGSSYARPLASGMAVRPWRSNVSHQVATARNGRSFELSTDRSRLGPRGPVDLNRRTLSTAGNAGSARATALPRHPGRTLTTGGPSALAAPAVGRAGSTSSTPPRARTGSTAPDQLQQRRNAYMDVLRGRGAGSGGAAESPSAGIVRPAFGAASPRGTVSSAPRTNHGFGEGGVARRSSATDIDPAVTAHHEEMRNSLLRRLNAMPGGSGAVPGTAGPARQHSTFRPQVAPQLPASPGNSAPTGLRSLTPRSLTPRSLTPRTLTTPTNVPSVTITPTPRTTSTAPPREMRFSRSTWPHDSTTTPGTPTPPSYTPRTFTPRTVGPSQAAPSAIPSTSYTPRTFTPRTVGPSQAAPSAAPSPSYTPRTFTPRTVGPSQAAPSAIPSRSYTPRTFTPRTVGPSQAPPSATPSRSYTPRTFTPRTVGPSQAPPSATPSRSSAPRTFTPRSFAPSQAPPSFSRSAPSFSRSSPSPRAPSGPTMSAPPARTYGPAPSQAPSMSQSDRSGSFSSRRAATADQTAPRGKRR